MTKYIQYLKGDHEGRLGEIAEVSEQMADSLIKDMIAVESNKEMYDRYCWSKVDATDCFGNRIKPFAHFNKTLPKLSELPILNVGYYVQAIKNGIIIESHTLKSFEEVVVYLHELFDKLGHRGIKIQIGVIEDEENSR